MPGPPPKKEAERRRRNKAPDGIETEIVNVEELVLADVEIPVADENWEPLTKSFYESFTRSGQVVWMEPTDWMTAYMLMEVLDRWLKPQDVKVGQTGSSGQETGGGDIDYIFEPKIVAMPGGVLTAILKGLTALLATEGDRRRLRIELERKSAVDRALESAGVPDIAKKREEAFRRRSREDSA